MEERGQVNQATPRSVYWHKGIEEEEAQKFLLLSTTFQGSGRIRPVGRAERECEDNTPSTALIRSRRESRNKEGREGISGGDRFGSWEAAGSKAGIQGVEAVGQGV